MSRYIFDTETDGLLDGASKIHCLVLYDLDTEKVWRFHGQADLPGWDGYVTDGLRLLMVADLIIGQNSTRFDIPVIQKFFPWFQPTGKHRDTLVMAKLIWPNLKTLDKGSTKLPSNLVGSHSLKAWGIRLGVLKGDYAEETDWKTFTPEMLEYCVQDVVGPTLTLWKLIQKKDYSEEAFQTEHDFTFVAHQMELHGFRFDVEAAQKLHVKLVKRKLELEEQLQKKYLGWWEDMKTPEHYIAAWNRVRVVRPTKSAAESECWKQIKPLGGKRKEIVFGAGPMAKKHTPFNAGSRDHIIKVLLEEHAWKPAKFTDGGQPKLDEDVLEHLDIPEAKLLIEYLMLGKRLGQLAEGDNAWLKLVGADGYIHGRIDSMGAVTSRCSHSNPNMAQIPAVDKPYGPECRSLFLPDPGHVLVGADASGIQLRVLAHYMGNWDGNEYARIVTQGDVHTENMKAIGLPSRSVSKTWIYAYLLGAGDAKLGLISGKSAKEGKAGKERIYSRFPALRALKEALKTRVAEAGGITGLDGRFCPCDSAHLAMGALLQSFEAIVMKRATVLFYNDLTARGYIHGVDWGICAHVHDEVQVSSRPDIADEVGKAFVNAIRRAGENLGSRCPLDGAYKIGANWAATH